MDEEEAKELYDLMLKRLYHSDIAEAFDFAMYCLHHPPTKWDNFNQGLFLYGALYLAGQIQGIRQERRLRAEETKKKKRVDEEEAKELYEVVLKRLYYSDIVEAGDFAMYCLDHAPTQFDDLNKGLFLFGALYFAGQIQGIRQERQRRAAKAVKEEKGD